MLGNLRSKDWHKVTFGLGVAAFAVRFLVRRDLVENTTGWVLVGLMVAAAFALWSYTRDRYRDYEYEPVRPDDLPRDTFAHFQQQTPEFMALGCGLVGDFRLARGPRPVFVRHFAPPDDRLYGECCDHDGTFAVSFVSVFEDGRLLETAHGSEAMSKMEPHHKLWFVVPGNVSIAELYSLHRESVIAYEQSVGSRAIKITRDRLAELSNYGHRLVWHELGKLPKRLGTPEPPRADRVAAVAARS